MKAITLHQPLADLLANGDLWALSSSSITHHRGPVLIHDAGVIPGLKYRGETPRALIAVAELTLCVSWDLVKRQALRTDRVAECLTGCHRTWGEIRREPHHDDKPFVWVLENVQRLEIAIPCRGHSGLWDVPAEILTQFNSHPQMAQISTD